MANPSAHQPNHLSTLTNEHLSLRPSGSTVAWRPEVSTCARLGEDLCHGSVWTASPRGISSSFVPDMSAR